MRRTTEATRSTDASSGDLNNGGNLRDVGGVRHSACCRKLLKAGFVLQKRNVQRKIATLRQLSSRRFRSDLHEGSCAAVIYGTLPGARWRFYANRVYHGKWKWWEEDLWQTTRQSTFQMIRWGHRCFRWIPTQFHLVCSCLNFGWVGGFIDSGTGNSVRRTEIQEDMNATAKRSWLWSKLANTLRTASSIR